MQIKMSHTIQHNTSDHHNMKREHVEFLEGGFLVFESNVMGRKELDVGFQETFVRVVGMYQEQPQLLDSLLEMCVRVLSSCLGSCVEMTWDEGMVYVSRFLYTLCRVRGYKMVLRCMPCDVEYVEPVFGMVRRMVGCASGSSRGSGVDKSTEEGLAWWECEYVLFMWSSQLAMVPFHFSVIDSSVDTVLDVQNKVVNTTSSIPMVAGLLEACRAALAFSTSVREMAAVCLGRMLTRPDMGRALEEFGEWVVDEIQVKKDDGVWSRFCIPGVVLTLATVYKWGSVNDPSVVECVMRFLPLMMESDGVFGRYQENNPLVRALVKKVIQRGALVCVSTQGSNNESMLDVIEMAIGSLLDGLSDSDTIVRWSCAKGVGRIAAKLPRDVLDDVLDSILQLVDGSVNELVTEDSWHGTCLAIAELSRRDLIASHRVDDIVPVIATGLEYDVRRGFTSVGTNVRDAAAYVCWALARRSESRVDMVGAFEKLGPVLMTTACYDREVNCRRAAAAAFQECVGRLGSVSYGIDILTVADYFTVSLRQSAYLQVAPEVARFPGYHTVFAKHLLDKKLVHWEASMRELSALGLASIVDVDVEFHKAVSLERLLPRCASPILDYRHGAMLGVAHILIKLWNTRSDGPWLDDALQKRVAEIVPNAVEKGLITKGVGAELMRSAVCQLIQSIADTGISLESSDVQCMLDVCLENVRHPSANVQIEAVKGLSKMLDTSYTMIEVKGIVEGLINDVGPDLDFGARRGAALSFGYIPSRILEQYHDDILRATIEAAHIEEQVSVRDVETRVNAIKSLPHVVASLGKDVGDDSVEAMLHMTLDCLYISLEDYSTDNRGDIGSWVREASATSLVAILGGHPPKAYSPSLLQQARRCLCKVARLTIERISRVRQHTGSILNQIASEISTDVDLDHLYHHISDLSETAYLDGTASSQIVKAMTPNDEDLTREILKGLIYSIGGLDAELQEHTSSSLVAFFNSSQVDTCSLLGQVILAIWESEMKSSRLSIPCITTVDLLLSRTILIHDTAFVIKAIELVQQACNGSGDVGKLCKASALLGTIIGEDAGSPPAQPAIRSLVDLMGKKYPHVRKVAAEQLYTAMLVWDEDSVPESIHMDKAMAILEETAWQGPASIVRPARMELSQRLGFEIS